MQQGLQGYGPGCADVSAEGASSPPADAGKAPSRADRWGRPYCRPDSASALRQRKPATGCRGGCEGYRPPSCGYVPPPATDTRGPAPLASPDCPRRKRKGERTGSSLGGYEQIPRKRERGPEEVRSTPQPTRGPRPLRGGGKRGSAGLPLLPRCPSFSSRVATSLLLTSAPPPRTSATTWCSHNSERSYPTTPNLPPPSVAILWQPLTTFLHWIYFAIKTLGMKPKL